MAEAGSGMPCDFRSIGNRPPDCNGLSTTAVDMAEARHRVVGNDTAGRGTDVGAATLTTTAHGRWSGAFAISVDRVAGGSPER